VPNPPTALHQPFHEQSLVKSFGFAWETCTHFRHRCLTQALPPKSKQIHDTFDDFRRAAGDKLKNVVGGEDADKIAGLDYSNEIGWHAVLPGR
jgi:hypothetical protein